MVLQIGFVQIGFFGGFMAFFSFPPHIQKIKRYSSPLSYLSGKILLALPAEGMSTSNAAIQTFPRELKGKLNGLNSRVY